MAWSRAVIAPLLTLAVMVTAVDAQIAVLSRSIEEQEVRPGEQYDLALLVRNSGTRPQMVKIYQTDYLFLADGRSFFEAPGTNARSNAPWLSIENNRMTIPAGGTATVPYRVRVPNAAGDSLVGTYWSMVMVETTAGTDSVAADTGSVERRGELAVNLRYGTQVVTHIGSTGAATVEFTEAYVTDDSASTRALVVDIVNRGTRGRRLNISLELFTAGGERVTKITSKRGLVLPGTSIRQRFPLGKLAPGAYRALVITDAGMEALFGAE
jgi:hypothetical protein